MDCRVATEATTFAMEEALTAKLVFAIPTVVVTLETLLVIEDDLATAGALVGTSIPMSLLAASLVLEGALAVDIGLAAARSMVPVSSTSMDSFPAKDLASAGGSSKDNFEAPLAMAEGVGLAVVPLEVSLAAEVELSTGALAVRSFPDKDLEVSALSRARG